VHLPRRRRRLSMARSNGFSVLDMARWTGARWWRCLTSWWRRWQVWREAALRCAEREVEVTSGACAQGTFFGFYQGVGDGGDRGTRPGLSLLHCSS
jgi:hypothetical protein